MKLLLDEQLPVKLKYRLQPLFVSTVRDEQWLGIKNGSLIQLAITAGFTIFLTNDQSLYFQQKIKDLDLLFINLNQPSNRYDDLLPVVMLIGNWLIERASFIDAKKSRTTTWFIRLILRPANDK